MVNSKPDKQGMKSGSTGIEAMLGMLMRDLNVVVEELKRLRVAVEGIQKGQERGRGWFN